MAEVRLEKLEIARRQLEMAVLLFINDRDHLSAITLAGAAGNILEQLVRNKGMESFIDYCCRVTNYFIGRTPPRDQARKRINDRLGVNSLKHHAPDDNDFIELDEKIAAHDAIGKAMADYIKLRGNDEPFVISFFSWSWAHKNGSKIMDEYKDFPVKQRP